MNLIQFERALVVALRQLEPQFAGLLSRHAMFALQPVRFRFNQQMRSIYQLKLVIRVDRWMQAAYPFKLMSLEYRTMRKANQTRQTDEQV